MPARHFRWTSEATEFGRREPNERKLTYAQTFKIVSYNCYEKAVGHAPINTDVRLRKLILC